MREKVLGFPVDVYSKDETFSVISDWFKVGFKRPKVIVTAYSEFYVSATIDSEFGKIINGADFVTPDGNSVLAAVAFCKATRTQSLVQVSLPRRVLNNFREGVRVGGRILSGSLGETVTGVWLFEKIVSEAPKRNWKVFLLGGEHNSSERAKEILLKRLPGIRVGSHSGEKVLGLVEEENNQIIEIINKFKPDFLFVTYPAVEQYKWIWKNKDRLKVGVALGIGGTLDEFVGDLRLTPKWMESVGLKWLWRLWLQPKRWRRIVNAVIVFPWMVFKESLKK